MTRAGHISVAEFHKLVGKAKPKRAHKYNAKRVQVDGYLFDSLAESKRYADLAMLQRGGAISGLVVHPRFPLTVGAKIIGEIELDFAYTQNDQRITEDVKGVLLPMFRWKRKHFLAQYPHIALLVTDAKGRVRRVRTREISRKAA